MKKTGIKSITAYEKIRDGILTGEYVPSSRLILADLQEQLRLGQGPIRDALLRLEKTGLVENIPYKGAIVKELPSIDEMRTIYKARIAVETDLAVFAMQKMTSAKLSQLQRIVTASQKDINETHKFFNHDRKFHVTLYAIADAPHLVDILSNLHNYADIFLHTYAYTVEYCSLSIEHHIKILEALQAKNIEALSTALRANIELGFDYVASQARAYGRLRSPSMSW